MSASIKLVPTFEIQVSEHDFVNLTVWELTALQLWLLMAINCVDAKPLWLKDERFGRREGDLIFLTDAKCKLNRGQVIDLINAIEHLTRDESTGIYMLGIHYPASNSWQSEFNTVDVKETMAGSFIGYWREDTGEPILPVKLRWSEDLGVWYGIKGVTHPCTSFYFKDLTISQI